MIKINSLHKYFNRGRQNEIHVLNDISLDLPERGMVAIFGRSGCGKTTLLNVIGGLDSYLSGSVEIGGDKISTGSDALRNRHIGYIFQNYNLNSAQTCFDIVADALRLCGMSDKKDETLIRERTMAALSAVGLAHYAARYPDTLSGGQKQRIAIARAIVKSPDIILADEPTGNLDETNTVMIMDMLREIAKTRLVLLVTHEANLVDSYCDRVIGITDGRIASVRENDISAGFAVKNKNHIYLGEFEKTNTDSGALSIDYYGEPAEGKIKLTVVNDGGKLFLRVDTPGVHIIDEYGETKLHEGVFEKKEEAESKSSLDLSLLTPFEGKKYGSLFSFFSSLKSGSRILTGKKLRRGKKVLKTRNLLAASYLSFFAFVFTLLISYCASGIAVYDSIADKTNMNMFYISLSEVDNKKLADAVDDSEACIDFLYVTYDSSLSGSNISLSTGRFETFSMSSFGSYSANAPVLTHTILRDPNILAGSIDDLGKYDVVLSKSAADALLQTAIYEYISEYEDLISCEISRSYHMTDLQETLKIAAVADTGELAVYLHPMSLSSLAYINAEHLSVARASDYGIKLQNGEAMVGSASDVDYLPMEGETFKVNGISVTAKAVAANKGRMSYSSWLSYMGISEERSDLESYYSHLEKYALYCFLSGHDADWIDWYFPGSNENALFVAVDDLEYYAACRYRDKNGSFPSSPLSGKEIESYKSDFDALKKTCYDFYMNGNYNYNHLRYYPSAVYLSDDDYSAAISGFGETHAAAMNGEIGKYNYLVIHSTDPDATEAYLRSKLPDLSKKDPDGYYDIFVTPSLRLSSSIAENRIEIISSLVTIGVGMALMCICIYFIMRSAMLSRVREIGIYRAVGVSSKNLIFKFAVESAAVALRTLVVGFALGAYLASTLASGGVTASTFYFPFWLGVLTLILLVGTCVLFGILPIAMLLRKTPAQILAKYDI